MEGPLKMLAKVSGSTRAIAVAEAHRAHETATLKDGDTVTVAGEGTFTVTVPAKVEPKPRSVPLKHALRAADPARPKKLSRDMRERLSGLNSPSANDRALRAQEKRARKAAARLACQPSI